MRSGDLSLDEVVRDARVLARPRKSGELVEVGVGGEPKAAFEKAGWEAERLAEVSDWYDWDREEIGTVKLFTLPSEERGFDICDPVRAMSCGTSSGAGIGRPLAAATSWCSVHESE